MPYNVSIAAMNRAGPGKFSVFIHFTRELGTTIHGYIQRHYKYNCFPVPRVAPKNVTITRPSPTVMVVSWIPLNYSEARGFISHYTVAYTPVSRVKRRQAPATMTQTVPGMDVNTTRIEGLDANTDYIVQVSVTNGAGKNDLSAPLLAAVPMATEGKTSLVLCLHDNYYMYLHVLCALATVTDSALTRSTATAATPGQGVHGAVIGNVVVAVVVLLVVTVMGIVIVVLILKMRRYKQ